MRSSHSQQSSEQPISHHFPPFSPPPRFDSTSLGPLRLLLHRTADRCSAARREPPRVMSSSHSLSAASAPMQDTVQLVGAAAAEDLSRMEGEYGSRMIGALKQMDVLIVGLRGLGVETAKNLILAGPHSVTLYDQQPTVVADLGSNFYLSEQHIGIARGPSLLAALGELNPNVNVQLHTGDMQAAFIQQFDVVCVTTDDYPLQQLNAWNAACRARQRPNTDSGSMESTPGTFLLSSMLGCYGWLFADFGPHHLCFDDNGVAARAIVVDHISQAEHGAVTIDGDRHLLNDGDLIKLEEVGGMSDDVMHTHSDEHIFKHTDTVTSINATHEIKTTKNPKRFTIGDTRGLKEYVSGGVGLQVKRQITFAHQPLSQQLLNPTFITGYIDFTSQLCTTPLPSLCHSRLLSLLPYTAAGH